MDKHIAEPIKLVLKKEYSNDLHSYNLTTKKEVKTPFDASVHCILDDSPLGFKHGWFGEVGKLEPQDPLEEVNLAEDGTKPRQHTLVHYYMKI